MNKTEQKFVATIWEYYTQQGRHQLPWRQTQDPYHILVSELMLQQTQVQRVVPKYEAFVQRWPTVQQLAAAQQRDVLIAWQGLGYNRRAKFLHQCAQTIVSDFGGSFPRTRAALEALPGIGPYTAGAILAFAYNQPVVLIETNVRRVYLHHFFLDQEQVADTAIYPILERTLPAKRAREWYAALMDYGSELKKTVGNPNQKSRHYTKQSAFTGSDREIRGAILRVLVQENLTVMQIQKQLPEFEAQRVHTQLQALLTEGLTQKAGQTYCL